jgi:hypothetical protein
VAKIINLKKNHGLKNYNSRVAGNMMESYYGEEPQRKSNLVSEV